MLFETRIDEFPGFEEVAVIQQIYFQLLAEAIEKGRDSDLK